MSFRIRLWPTFFTVLGLAILISLGSWQLSRYLDASAFEEERDARIDDSVLSVDSSQRLADTEFDFRRIKIDGSWDRERLFLIRHRVYDGDPGYWIVTALRADSDAGADEPALLVNRGWIHREDGPPEAERILEELHDGTDTVTGLLHPLDEVVTDEGFRDAYTGDETPTEVVELDTYDVTAIQDSLPYKTVDRPVIITESAKSWDRELPVASHDHITQPYLTAETHFGYMLTWYLLALALIAIWLAHAFGVLRSRAYDEPESTS